MAFYCGYHGDAHKWTTPSSYDPSYYYHQTPTPFQSDYQHSEPQMTTDHISPSSYTDHWSEPPPEQSYPLFRYPQPIDYHQSPCNYYADLPKIKNIEPIEYHHSAYSYYTDPSEIRYVQPIEYHHSAYSYYTDPSVIKYCEPKLLQYHPSSYSTHYLPADTKFTISYSTSITQEFNEPEFEEYDPTPYGGGYDQDTTYGRSLPPSDTICYPRKLPQYDGGANPEVFSYSSIPSPYGKDDDDVSIKSPVVEKEDDDPPIKSTVVEKEDDDPPIKSPVVEKEDEVNDDYEIVGQPDVIPPAAEPPISETGYREEYFYGSGLESLDLCDALFGYWPCLAKRQERLRMRRKMDEIYEEESRMDPWNRCAEYFFGGPDYNNKAQHLQYP